MTTTTTASRSDPGGRLVDARAILQAAGRRVDAALDELLGPDPEVPGALLEAMRYSALGPGKRLRPALALAACRAFGGEDEACLRPAAALEMIHAYSLVHDDLPAMDDDDLRRGRPTSHVVYGEALAILAGDALHTRACEVLATWPAGDDRAALRSRVQQAVLGAIGARGMVGGQAVDIALTGRGGSVSEAELEGIHRRKTGALIRSSVVLGSEIGGASADQVEAMGRFGAALGLAFQVIDDILDVTAETTELGKTRGKDAAAQKVTYPAVLGLEGARCRAEALTHEALALLRAVSFPDGGDPAPLVALATFVLERRS
jgi:geranylgeranyl pyrophosphate synthase